MPEEAPTTAPKSEPPYKPDYRACGEDHNLAVWYDPTSIRQHFDGESEMVPAQLTDYDLAAAASDSILENDPLWAQYARDVGEIVQVAIGEALARAGPAPLLQVAPKPGVWFEVHGEREIDGQSVTADDAFRHEPCDDDDCPGPEPYAYESADAARAAITEAQEEGWAEKGVTLRVERVTTVREVVTEVAPVNPAP